MDLLCVGCEDGCWMELAQDYLHCQGLVLLDFITAEVIVVLQSNDHTFIKRFLQPRPFQFFYDMDSPTDEGNERKKARKDKQQHKRQPPKFDEGNVHITHLSVQTLYMTLRDWPFAMKLLRILCS
jgi:hypothetical protein